MPRPQASIGITRRRARRPYNAVALLMHSTMDLLIDFTTAPTDVPGLPPDAVWHTAVLRDVDVMNESQLTSIAFTAYERLRRKLVDQPRLRAARFWNFIPGITRRTTDGRDRYMAFNAGRYRALTEWYGDVLARYAPAATGVGAPGRDLVVHLLATPRACTPVQNPQQVRAMEYSARYGPLPPCFSRATRVGNTLLVSGTAAIRGEGSVGIDDLAMQLDVTLDHLRTLAGDLSRYASLRVYVKRAGDVAAVAAHLQRAFPAHTRIDYAVTDLCRPELLVEIEGIARESDTP